MTHSEELPIIPKGFAYITRSHELLVFEHADFPEASIQVPAGTLHAGESTQAGALREAYEETGLKTLKVADFLGETMFDMRSFRKQEIHHRYFYHFTITDQVPDQWDHYEENPSDNKGRIRFRFYWENLLAGIPNLVAGHGQFIPSLMMRLNISNGNKNGDQS